MRGIIIEIIVITITAKKVILESKIMGAEITDPLKACCCANTMKINDHITTGNSP